MRRPFALIALGGFDAIIPYRLKERSIFLYGFAKNERDNIDAEDLEILKELRGFYGGSGVVKVLNGSSK